ncbi:hypothetical protein PR202_ga27979 [Eleusine coracana subsp. coracana]|uniref:Uncharacterized protein n=1 Tax=Eleusine coracana subsp. coracana TaxID=191504 RepID=A0AAV5DJ30_ELECO|nr:hypothetical protein PR202_ga27979 [Eleusine coracana subsp. coracana]
MDGREVMDQGLIRRIGNGATTLIWEMNWLPTGSMRKPVLSTLPDKPRWVSELIDHTTAAWDVEKLERFFTPADREAILNIPICTRQQQDYWAWHHEKKGMFTVRSAYRMLISGKALLHRGGDRTGDPRRRNGFRYGM